MVFPPLKHKMLFGSSQIMPERFKLVLFFSILIFLDSVFSDLIFVDSVLIVKLIFCFLHVCTEVKWGQGGGCSNDRGKNVSTV